MKKINHWINGKNVAGSEYFQTTNPPPARCWLK